MLVDGVARGARNFADDGPLSAQQPVQQARFSGVRFAHQGNFYRIVFFLFLLRREERQQFVEQVDWGALDFMIVDMPPGTGDAQLSLVQTVRVDGVVMVTTPQDVATSDVRRAIKMFERVNTPVLGVVENMSGFVCPCCGTVYDLFGKGGGQQLADAAGIPLLGQVPLELTVRESGDEGAPIVLSAPESRAAQTFRSIADKVAGMVSR